MVPDDQQKQSTQEAQIAADLAALSARVESLERQLAELRGEPSVRLRQSAPPPPYHAPTPNAESPSAPNFAKHLPNTKGSLEDRVGSQYFGRIGIVALLIGAFLFLKWAIDNHWIGPLGRVLVGLIAGAGLGGLDWMRVKRVLGEVGAETKVTLQVFEQFVRARERGSEEP